MMGRMKCSECKSEKLQGCEFDGSCIQCRNCGAMWNSMYSFYLTRKADEEEANNKTEEGRHSLTA